MVNASASTTSKALDIIAAIRVRQWIKNLVIPAVGLAMMGPQPDLRQLGLSLLLAFAAFCIAASAHLPPQRHDGHPQGPGASRQMRQADRERIQGEYLVATNLGGPRAEIDRLADALDEVLKTNLLETSHSFLKKFLES